MPVPGGETNDLNRLEAEWHNRLTYPTGLFDPAWLRAAATQDAFLQRSIPAGVPVNLSKSLSPLALNPTGFTSLGPKPLRMTGCSGCFSYNFAEGRINDIVIDPTTTTNGSIVAYAASVGGGVWKTTNCCSSSTSWTVVTDDPLISTVSVDTLTIDPSNHNTIYAGTGDLNYGSFSMGSQGILKSTDAGATWTVKGADVFGPGLPLPAGQFPQYQAVGKVRVDPNNSNNVVAGTKTGLYFSYDGGDNWTGPCTTNGFTGMRQDITGLALIDLGATTRIIAAVGVRGFATTVQYNLDQNGANGIYSGTLPASGCPTDFASIATNANGWTGLNAGSGVAYVRRRAPAINSAASTSRSRRAIRIIFMRRSSRSRPTRIPAATMPKAASSPPIAPRMAALPGRRSLIRPAIRSEIANSVTATIRKIGTTRASPSIRTTLTAFSSIPSTSGFGTGARRLRPHFCGTI